MSTVIFHISGLCLLSHISGLISPVSCLLSPVSCLLSHIFCLTSPVSCLLSHISCLTSLVSCLLYHISCLMSPLSHLLYNFSCLQSHVLRHILKSSVSCLLFPVPALCLTMLNCFKQKQTKKLCRFYRDLNSESKVLTITP